MPRIRLAAPAVALALGLGFVSQGAAQGPYPVCDPSLTAAPSFGAAGFPENEAGDARLFATHPVTIGATLPFTDKGQLVSDMAMDPLPPGLTVVTDADSMTNGGVDDTDRLAAYSSFVGESAGTFPFRLTWMQTDDNGRNPCSASAPTSVTLIAPIATVRLGKPKDTRGLAGDESQVTLRIPRLGGDRRPLEVRYRAVRVQRFPGAGAKGRTIPVPMRSTDPGFKRNRQVNIQVGGLQARIEPENGDAVLQRFSVRFEIHAGFKGTNYGYDLDVRQGGRTVTRLRVAGRCQRTGGFVNCKRKKVKLTP